MHRALLLICCLAWLAIGAGHARADELVEVAPHRAAPPLPPARATPTPPLLGFLTRPYGPGPFPAVVELHWCSGFSGHDTATAALLKSWGYVTLAIDSLGSANMCRGGGGSVAELHDALTALRYLAGQEFVIADRIAVLGYSMGAIAALAAVDNGPLTRPQPRFAAAIAYYPMCAGVSGDMLAPTLILIGAQDDWASPEDCRKLAAKQSDIGITRTPGVGAPIDLTVYPDATHAFDADEPPRHYLGHFMRYDAVATADALAKVKAFLDRYAPAGERQP